MKKQLDIKNILKDSIKQAYIGFPLLILGIFLGFIFESNRNLENYFALLDVLGIMLITPLLIKTLLFIIKHTWKLFRRMIYEILYVATKAIVDAKKPKDNEEKQ